MPLAAWKDLCLDAVDPVVIGTFWSQVLRLDLTMRDDGVAMLRGSRPEETVWVNPVPEPRTVKNRMHLDVNTASVAELLHLGATVVDDESFHWTVLADPEGGEFCAFVRDGSDAPITGRLHEIVVDCAAGDGSGSGPHALAAWWADLLGARVVDDPRGYSWVEAIPGAPFGSLDVVPVPEPKRVKNRVHPDVTCAAVEPLLAAGATLLRAQDATIGWSVLADPGGNEFCAFLDTEAAH